MVTWTLSLVPRIMAIDPTVPCLHAVLSWTVLVWRCVQRRKRGSARRMKMCWDEIPMRPLLLRTVLRTQKAQNVGATAVGYMVGGCTLPDACLTLSHQAKCQQQSAVPDHDADTAYPENQKEKLPETITNSPGVTCGSPKCTQQ